MDIDTVDLTTLEGRLDFILMRSLQCKKFGSGYTVHISTTSDAPIDKDVEKLYPYKNVWVIKDDATEDEKEKINWRITLASQEYFNTLIHHLREEEYIDFGMGTLNVSLTIKGESFILNGGYTQEKKDKIKAKKFRNRIDVAVALGTSMAGLYGVYEIGKALYLHFFQCN